MPVSSLGRTATLPSFREPVAPLGGSELGGARQTKGSFTVTELDTHRSAPEAQGSSPLEPFARVSLSRAVDNVDEVQKFQELMRRNSVEFVNSAERHSDFDAEAFLQDFPSEVLEEHLAEIQAARMKEVTSNDVSFDSSTPINRSTVLIKERLNDAEFIRRLPSTVANSRLTEMVSFTEVEDAGAFAAVA